MSADPSTYYSVRNADEFLAIGLDWPAFYERADAATAEARRQLETELDLSYGPDPKQALDVYHPAKADTANAIFVFLHGGGYREGDRAHYGFVAPALARRGARTVIPSYRLLPRWGVAAAIEDAANAVRWVAERYPDNAIVLSGHSAGGALAARIGGAPKELLGTGFEVERIRGILPISANYDLAGELTPSYLADSFADLESRRDASPLHRVSEPAGRAVVAVGEREGPYLALAGDLVAELARHGATSRRLVLEGLRHDQTVFGLAQTGDPLFTSACSLLRSEY